MATRLLKISSNGNKIFKSKLMTAPSCMIIFNFSFPFSIGTATKGWMLYYGAAIGILGALDSTPIRSLVSKMVEPTEFGKLFTFLSTAQGLTSLMTSSGFQEIYAKTITTYPGAMYLVSAGLSAIAVVKVYFISVMK